MTPDRLAEIRRSAELVAYTERGEFGGEKLATYQLAAHVVPDLLAEVERLTAELARVGICGDRIAGPGVETLLDSICDLPAGHDGWHGANSPPHTIGAASRVSWTTDAEGPVALMATCCCGTSPMTYEGPEPDCPVHGAVRAFNEAQQDIAQLQAVVEHLTAQLRQAKEERAAVALERDEAINDRGLAVAHDRQPYPTADAYEAACRALRKHRDIADRATALLVELANAGALPGPQAGALRSEFAAQIATAPDTSQSMVEQITALTAERDAARQAAEQNFTDWQAAKAALGHWRLRAEVLLPVVEAAKAWRASLVREWQTPAEALANVELRTKHRMALQDAVDEWQRTQEATP